MRETDRHQGDLINLLLLLRNKKITLGTRKGFLVQVCVGVNFKHSMMNTNGLNSYKSESNYLGIQNILIRSATYSMINGTHAP
jgi:hypothetical protein